MSAIEFSVVLFLSDLHSSKEILVELLDETNLEVSSSVTYLLQISAAIWNSMSR